jgi:hypothetical protein
MWMYTKNQNRSDKFYNVKAKNKAIFYVTVKSEQQNLLARFTSNKQRRLFIDFHKYFCKSK